MKSHSSSGTQPPWITMGWITNMIINHLEKPWKIKFAQGQFRVSGFMLPMIGHQFTSISPLSIIDHQSAINLTMVSHQSAINSTIVNCSSCSSDARVAAFGGWSRAMPGTTSFRAHRSRGSSSSRAGRLHPCVAAAQIGGRDGSALMGSCFGLGSDN